MFLSTSLARAGSRRLLHHGSTLLICWIFCWDTFGLCLPLRRLFPHLEEPWVVLHTVRHSRAMLHMGHHHRNKLLEGINNSTNRPNNSTKLRSTRTKHHSKLTMHHNIRTKHHNIHTKPIVRPIRKTPAGNNHRNSNNQPRFRLCPYVCTCFAVTVSVVLVLVTLLWWVLCAVAQKRPTAPATTDAKAESKSAPPPTQSDGEFVGCNVLNVLRAWVWIISGFFCGCLLGCSVQRISEII